MASLPEEHRRAGEAILDAGYRAGAYHFMGSKAVAIASEMNQKLQAKQGAKRGSPRDPIIRDEELDRIASLDGAKRKIALDQLAEAVPEIKRDSIRRAVDRRRRLRP